MGRKTLSEVQHKLSLMKKNKVALEAELHFYENKLEEEDNLPKMSLNYWINKRLITDHSFLSENEEHFSSLIILHI